MKKFENIYLITGIRSMEINGIISINYKGRRKRRAAPGEQTSTIHCTWNSIITFKGEIMKVFIDLTFRCVVQRPSSQSS